MFLLPHKLGQYFGNNLSYGENSHGAFRRHFLSVSSLVQPDQGREWGTDISPWDGNVNLSVTKAMGAAFTVIKAIDGTLQTRYFVENRARARDAGMVDGSYGWLYRNVNVSCVAQAQAYTNLLNKYPVSLPPVIDFEPTKWAGAASNPTFSDLRIWAAEWLRLGNPKPILYSAAYYMNQFGPIPADLKAMFAGLWVAHYGVINPDMPWGYVSGEWLFHQFSSSGDAAILSPNDVNKKEVDLDYFKGTQDDLIKLAGGVVEPPPPDPDHGGTMKIYVNKVTTAGLNGRSAPDSSVSNVVISFVQNDILVCDKELLAGGASWRRVRAAVRAGAPVVLPATTSGEIWASDGSAGTLQGELASFDVQSVDLASVRVLVSMTPTITFVDDLGNTIVEKTAKLDGELL